MIPALFSTLEKKGCFSKWRVQKNNLVWNIHKSFLFQMIFSVLIWWKEESIPQIVGSINSILVILYTERAETKFYDQLWCFDTNNGNKFIEWKKNMGVWSSFELSTAMTMKHDLPAAHFFFLRTLLFQNIVNNTAVRRQLYSQMCCSKHKIIRSKFSIF